MARPLRIEFEGALYHITSRGNERRSIYRKEADYRKFLTLLSDLPKRYGIITHGYVLMNNHYHLLCETPRANITRGIHYLNSSYTGYFNRKYKRAGHLFQGRYKGLLIEKDNYLLLLSRYIHLNPVRAGLAENPEDYKWSSYSEYIGKSKKKEWVMYEWILSQFDKDGSKALGFYKEFIEEGIGLNENPFKELKMGLILGSERFIEKVKSRIKLKKRREIPESRFFSRIVKYEEIISAIIKRFKISEKEIKEAGKRENLARKICLYLLRTQTDMSNKEIGEKFDIGYTGVSQAVSRVKREMKKNQRVKKIIDELEKELMCEE
jgi:REP element-mobilizing transposase RayT